MSQQINIYIDQTLLIRQSCLKVNQLSNCFNKYLFLKHKSLLILSVISLMDSRVVEPTTGKVGDIIVMTERR